MKIFWWLVGSAIALVMFLPRRVAAAVAVMPSPDGVALVPTMDDWVPEYLTSEGATTVRPADVDKMVGGVTYLGVAAPNPAGGRPIIGAGLPVADVSDTAAAASTQPTSSVIAVGRRARIADVQRADPVFARLLNTSSPFFNTHSATVQQQHMWIARRSALSVATGQDHPADDPALKQFVFALWYAVTGQRINTIFGVA